MRKPPTSYHIMYTKANHDTNGVNNGLLYVIRFFGRRRPYEVRILFCVCRPTLRKFPWQHPSKSAHIPFTGLDTEKQRWREKGVLYVMLFVSLSFEKNCKAVAVLLPSHPLLLSLSVLGVKKK